MPERRTDVNPLYSKDAANKTPQPGTPGAEGAGTARKLAGPVPPDLNAVQETSVMGVVPPDPTSSDEAGEIDHTHGDARRVREDPRGSGTPDGERVAREQLRKELHEQGATDVSETD